MEALLKEINTQQEAIELANEIERIEATLKQLKDNLRGYVEVHGPVNTGEKVWSCNNSVSWRFADMRKLAEGIVLDGKNPWAFMTITAANLKKLGWDDVVIEAYGGKKSVTTRFSGRKS